MFDSNGDDGLARGQISIRRHRDTARTVTETHTNTITDTDTNTSTDTKTETNINTNKHIHNDKNRHKETRFPCCMRPCVCLCVCIHTSMCVRQCRAGLLLRSPHRPRTPRTGPGRIHTYTHTRARTHADLRVSTIAAPLARSRRACVCEA